MPSLPAKGWILSNANAINDAGQITGDGSINGQAHVFLLTPDSPAPVAPLPSTAWMGLALLCGLGVAKTARRKTDLVA